MGFEGRVVLQLEYSYALHRPIPLVEHVRHCAYLVIIGSSEVDVDPKPLKLKVLGRFLEAGGRSVSHRRCIGGRHVALQSFCVAHRGGSRGRIRSVQGRGVHRRLKITAAPFDVPLTQLVNGALDMVLPSWTGHGAGITFSDSANMSSLESSITMNRDPDNDS